MTRKRLTHLPVPERRKRRMWCEVGSADAPDKLVLRSNAGPNDLFAVFNLTPLAGHGHFDAPALLCLTCDDTALMTDTCYGDRRSDDHSQLVVKRLRGGRLISEPPTCVKVTRFDERPGHTFCEVQCGDYTGWGAQRTRQILFVKNALIWVRDLVELGQPMEVSAGPLWFAGEMPAARGANWFDVKWNEPRGFRWLWRNGDRRLLIWFAPQPGTKVDVELQRWKTQRQPWEWSPPWVLSQRRPQLSGGRGTRVHFNTLLIPHGPDLDPAELAAGVRMMKDGVDSTTLEVDVRGSTWRLVIGEDAASVEKP